MIPASAWVYISSTDPCPDGRWKQQGALLYISVHGYISNYQASPSCPVARCRSVAKQTVLDQKLLLLHLHGELVLLVEKIIRPGPPIIWHLILTPTPALLVDALALPPWHIWGLKFYTMVVLLQKPG